MLEEQELDPKTERPILRKTVSEELRLTVKMRNRMRAGDVIVAITSITITPVTVGATPVTYSAEAFEGTDFQAKFAGGEDRRKYKIDVLGVSLGGDILEGRVMLEVRD